MNLPPLTEAQTSLLIGSLLGDGGLSPTSSDAARFCESHSDKQHDYLLWKASALGSYISTIVRTEKRTDKGTYAGWMMSGVSCSQMRTLYDRFYPAPSRKKIFPADLKMDPLVLTVWYLDDGGLMNRYHPRITFGLDDLSLDRALVALRRFGLVPRVHHNTDGTKTITFPSQDRDFFSIVQPHVPPCMEYKLPPEDTTRRTALLRGRRLDQTKLSILYQGGMSLRDLSRTADVSVSTVRRHLQAPARRPGPTTTGLSLQVASVLVDDVGGDVGAARAILRRCGFPYPQVPDDASWDRGLRLVKRTPMHLVGDTLQPWTASGCSLCTPYFPNRYEARSRGVTSAYEAWHDDDRLDSAIRFQIKVGDPLHPHRVLRAVTMQHRTPSVFRPTVAKWIYDTYCPPGGKVWDPCTGYGGRLLGAWTSGVQYTGTDVDPRTIDGCRRMAERLQYEADLHCTPAEQFDPGDVDLVFTSPPYFDREQYSNISNQSWIRYADPDAWVEGFLLPVLRMSSKRSSQVILNVADIHHGRKLIPLVQLTIEAATSAGLDQQEHLRMPLARLNRKDAYESILVFSGSGRGKFKRMPS